MSCLSGAVVGIVDVVVDNNGDNVVTWQGGRERGKGAVSVLFKWRSRQYC